MMGGQFKAVASVPLGHLDVSVVLFEGTVQLLFRVQGAEGLPRPVEMNVFCDASTAPALRDLADRLDGLCAPGREPR